MCPNCGAPLDNRGAAPEGEQKANGGFIALSIFFPIVGIILGIVEMSKGNKKAGKTYIITAIISWAVWFLLGIIPLFFKSYWYNTGYSQGFEYGLGNNNAIVSLLF
jgi:hypothetical protein